MADPINKPSHYNVNWKGEQTIETYTYIRSWKMDYPESNIIKYVTRHPYKGKSLEDLKKARWYLDKLIKEVEEISTDNIETLRGGKSIHAHEV
jgi:hypothetical protein